MPLNPWIDADRRELENEATAEAWLARIKREEAVAAEWRHREGDGDELGTALGIINAFKFVAICVAAIALFMHFAGF